MPDQTPNIVVIQADQLAAAALGAYGNDIVRTPHIDALAESGVVFGRAYSNSPLCAPSRASMMTGELPSTIEAYDNAAEFASSIPTFAHHLRARGYRTTLAGRMHFIGPDQLHGFEERLTTDVYPADLEMVPDWSLDDDQRLPWYHDAGSVHTAGVAAATLQRDYDEEVLFRTLRHLNDVARGTGDDPFLLVSSFIHPHDPYEATVEHWARYDGAEIPLPAVPWIDPSEADPHSRRLMAMSELGDAAPSDETIRRARRAYYASVSYFDDHVGRIVAKLDELGLRENTVIVLTSDHGDMLGERGLWYKMTPFEGSARVPLIVNAPGLVDPGRVSQTVSLVDLLPTLVDVADGGLEEGAERAPVPTLREAAIDAPNPFGAGRSLVDLLLGGTWPGPGRAVIEYLAEGVRAPHLTYVRGNFKLVHCPGDPDLLFDLDLDLHELTDLSSDPAHAALAAELRAELLQGRDLDDLSNRVIASQRRRRLVREALDHGEPTPWDHVPMDRGSQTYVRGDFWTAINRGRLRAGG
ncbi:MAG: choline-sulfatase [Solirubrobacteraceae bacterium]|nr:choline-sulfatase [Solirubrobacteraceae bacterium]